MLQRGSQLHTLTQEQVNLIGCNVHIITLLERHLARCCTDKTDCIARYKDISVGRLTATVDNNIIHAVAENQQSTLCGQHLNSHTRLLCNLVTPDTSGIHRYVSTELLLLARTAVHNLNTNDTLLLADKLQHLVIGQHLCAIHLGVNKVCRCQTEGVNSSIGNANSSNHRGVCRGLQKQSLLRVDSIGTDTRSTARLDKLCLKLQAILGKADKQTISLLHAVAGNTAQNHILLNTLLCRLTIRNGITRTAMQQTVVTSRSTCSYIATLQK